MRRFVTFYTSALEILLLTLLTYLLTYLIRNNVLESRNKKNFRAEEKPVLIGNARIQTVNCQPIVLTMYVDVLLLLLLLLLLCVVVQGNPCEDSLYTELFHTRHYNRITHPVRDLSETTHVQLGLVLQNIVQVVCSSLCHYAGL